MSATLIFNGADVLDEVRTTLRRIESLPGLLRVDAVEARGAVCAGPAKLELEVWTPVRLPLGVKRLDVVKGLPTYPCAETKVRVVVSLVEDGQAVDAVPDAEEQLG